MGRDRGSRTGIRGGRKGVPPSLLGRVAVSVRVQQHLCDHGPEVGRRNQAPAGHLGPGRHRRDAAGGVHRRVQRATRRLSRSTRDLRARFRGGTRPRSGAHV
jgi:hypothetical protein